MNFEEQEIKSWEKDQRLCDMADALLKHFVEQKLNVRDSLRVLEKIKTTIETSVQSACWGSTLTCGPATNEASVWDRESVIAEVNRRKDQDDS